MFETLTYEQWRQQNVDFVLTKEAKEDLIDCTDEIRDAVETHLMLEYQQYLLQSKGSTSDQRA